MKCRKPPPMREPFILCRIRQYISSHIVSLPEGGLLTCSRCGSSIPDLLYPPRPSTLWGICWLGGLLNLAPFCHRETNFPGACLCGVSSSLHTLPPPVDPSLFLFLSSLPFYSPSPLSPSSLSLPTYLLLPLTPPLVWSPPALVVTS